MFRLPELHSEALLEFSFCNFFLHTLCSSIIASSVTYKSCISLLFFISIIQFSISVRFVKYRITGGSRRIIPPVRQPETTAILHKVFPAFLASDKFPSPSRFPTIILPPYPKPVQTHTSRFFVIFAMELADTASDPRCPSITEYMVILHPRQFH